jgi:hypothetical protein
MNGEKLAYSVAQFCAQHCISKSFLYSLWAEGKGPERLAVGQKTLITSEAAAAWRAARKESAKDREVRKLIYEKARATKHANKLKQEAADKLKQAEAA